MPRWFRHYAGLVRDEKLTAAALAAGQPIERAIWLWCAMLEDAAERQERGGFLIDLRGCAWALHCELADLAAIMAELQRAARIEFECKGAVCTGQIMAWPERQFESDNSTERSKAHRGRKKCNGDATLQ